MEELKLLIKSVAKNPITAMITLVILVQSYIMVEKLDKINETLVAIHKDNVKINDYINAEANDTTRFISIQQSILEKINYLIGGAK